MSIEYFGSAPDAFRRKEYVEFRKFKARLRLMEFICKYYI